MSRRETAFMGRIMASLSHEIKNVLATIKESAGLIEDILNLDPEKESPHRLRLNYAAANIKKQVDRGVDVVLGLNRFAHSMDEPRAEVDLSEIATQMSFLMERFAHKAGVTLHSLPYPKPLRIETDPFALEMLLAAAVDSCMGRVDRGSELRIQPCLWEGRMAIWIGRGSSAPPAAPSPQAPCPDDLARLREDLGHLKTRISEVGGSGSPALLVEFL